MRRRVKVVLTRVVDDAVERAAPFHAQHLVDAPEREVVAATRLITPGIGQPRPHADALHEGRRLPRGRHRYSRSLRPRSVCRAARYERMCKTPATLRSMTIGA